MNPIGIAPVGFLFCSECINPSEFAYGKPTSLYKGGILVTSF